MSVEDRDGVQMPQFCFDSVCYYADLEHREFRSTSESKLRVGFDGKRGRQFCRMAGILTCPACNASMIASRKDRAEHVRCVRCKYGSGRCPTEPDRGAQQGTAEAVSEGSCVGLTVA